LDSLLSKPYFLNSFVAAFLNLPADPGSAQTTCQIVFYLAWRLIDPAEEAKLLAFRTSNLHPSKEPGQGDCGRVNQIAARRQKVLSLRRQPFCHPSLVPATPGWESLLSHA